MIKNKIRLLATKLAGDNLRSRRAIKNVLFSLLLKSISIVVSFAMVPLLINKLTADSYGIWLTLTSIVSMLSFSDVGLGNGLKNLLTEALANKDMDRARKLVSTAYVIISVISIVGFFVFMIINRFLDWTLILNAPLIMKDELKTLVLIIMFFFCLQLVLNLLTSILQAYQQSSFSNLVNVCGQLFAFICIFVISKQMPHAGLVEYGVTLYAIPVIILLIATLMLFKKKYIAIRPSLLFFEKKYSKTLCLTGGRFFLIQLTALLLYQSNNLIIAQTNSNSDVAIYNIAYKYAGIASMVFSIILFPIWSATTDAFVQKDFEWIKKTINYLNKIWLLLVGVCFIQLLFANEIYKLWVGDGIEIDFMTTMLALLYFILNMKAGIYCNVINGTGRILMQFILYLFQVAIHIPLAIYLGALIGVKGVLISMCIIMFLNVIWMSKQCKMLINEKAYGWWKR